MNKKAQGLSMRTIVIAAISLLILVILIVLVVNHLKKIPPATSCEGIGGVCADDCNSLEGTYGVDRGNSGTAGGCEEGELCCIPVAT